MIVLYGATGYTGRLIATTFARNGLTPVLAGRREDALRAVAGELGLDYRVGGLDDIDLTGAQVLLNCAGPFSRTQRPLLRSCLAAGVAYLDLAGEVSEHQTAAAFDADARSAGVLVVPGVGFGIVPSDCLAAHVATRVRGAQTVEVALKSVGAVSRGTAEVVLGSLRSIGVRREDGRLAPRAPGAGRRLIDFGDGDGQTTVVTNPWRADLVASVPDVPDLETFMTFPLPVRALMRVPHGGLLRAVARRLPEGPGERALAGGRTAVWAQAVGADGQTATAVIHGPDAYTFTARAAEACVRRVLAGQAPAGVHTPAGAWGADLPLAITGVTRRDTSASG